MADTRSSGPPARLVGYEEALTADLYCLALFKFIDLHPRSLVSLGEIMGEKRVFLFIEKNSGECEKAVALLESLGVPFVKIDVDENSVRGWMILEFGTSKTPLVATEKIILVGLKEIERFFSRCRK